MKILEDSKEYKNSELSSHTIKLASGNNEGDEGSEGSRDLSFDAIYGIICAESIIQNILDKFNNKECEVYECIIEFQRAISRFEYSRRIIKQQEKKILELSNSMKSLNMKGKV